MVLLAALLKPEFNLSHLLCVAVTRYRIFLLFQRNCGNTQHSLAAEPHEGATDQIRHSARPQRVRRLTKDTERVAEEQIVKWRRRSHLKVRRRWSLPTLLHVAPESSPCAHCTHEWMRAQTANASETKWVDYYFLFCCFAQKQRRSRLHSDQL